MRKDVFERFFTTGSPEAESRLETVLKSHSVETLKGLFSALDPLVQGLEQQYEQVTEPEVLTLLQDTTLVGLLPAPHPILIHRFHANPDTHDWIQTFLWAVIYINLQSLQLFNTPGVQLFQVRTKD